ncbi:MAG: hypothetical protein DRO96_01960 [Candidatus Aenigmatarchaeota archaeon]|nr:MAG: hypothetical protein DRO96_01960 [Candidatus Aenigmarchaeota archaeon]
MKICQICLESNTLCEQCKEKLRKGIINQEEVDVSRAIHSLAKANPELKDVEIDYVADVGKLLVFAPPEHAKKLIGPGGRNVKALNDKIGRFVRIVPRPRSDKYLIKELLGNVPLMGIDVLYTESGQVFQVRVSKDHASRIRIKPKKFEEIMKKLTGKTVELVFE